MGRLLTTLFLLTCAVGVARAQDGTQRFHGAIETSFLSASTPLDSWLDGGVGKLRHDEGSDGPGVSRALMTYSGRLTDRIQANATLDLRADGETRLTATEAYLEYRPVPRSSLRWRARAGFFYPRISLEHVEAGWSTPYSVSPSAINTWVGEELRTMGVELRLQHNGRATGSPHSFGLESALFYGNDTAGTLLAWRGWSLHDRQSGLSDRLPLGPLPVLQTGGTLDHQDPYTEPFREIDGRAGYYLNAQWQYARRLRVRAMHYDNLADPDDVDSGQSAWRTRFRHVGAQLALPGGFALIAQWMSGETATGASNGEYRTVEAPFAARSASLTHAWRVHRWTVRFDDFEVEQRDRTRHDNNNEDGTAWTVAYFHQLTPSLRTGAEWMQIDTHRCGWVYYALPQEARERLLQVTLRWQFGG